jgi:6,7-dimethyl-8-ribityllumazine synthase
MPNRLEGRLDASGRRFAVVTARFNSLVVERLLEGTLDAFRRHGAADDDITVVSVPGSWEIPMAAERLARSGRYHGVVALGVLIRGETTHFDLIAGEAAGGLARATAVSGVPVTLGILTCEDLQQALERAGGKHGNKGWDAALAAIEMADLLSRLDSGGTQGSSGSAPE